MASLWSQKWGLLYYRKIKMLRESPCTKQDIQRPYFYNSFFSHDTLRPIPCKAIPADRRVLEDVWHGKVVLCRVKQYRQLCKGLSEHRVAMWAHSSLTDTVTAPTFQKGIAGISSYHGRIPKLPQGYTIRGYASYLDPGPEARQFYCSVRYSSIIRATDIYPSLTL